MCPVEEAQPTSGQAPVTRQIPGRGFGLASPVTAGALAVLVLLLAGASVPLYAVAHQDVLANGVENVVLGVIFGSVGLVVARRQPRNPIGWLMLAGPALELLSIDGTSSPTARVTTCRSVSRESCLTRPGSSGSGSWCW